ncbi:hypothetical protein ANANG_G00132270 [Anguilla anguilla]|uniref:Uncharacterized protein n=1 Tax=Anguilla anguilla TaxID=7936 RepID=A0A9D3MIQ4_ANGAN|nr:hypothetical protein ANANG_G00132270 [Anguilla anguilla]
MGALVLKRVAQRSQRQKRKLSTYRKRVHPKRAGSPVPSCLSVKSDHSMDLPVKLRGEFTGDQRVHPKRAGSPVPSCLSVKSDHSMDLPVKLRGEFTGDQRVHQSLESWCLGLTSSPKQV